MLLELQAYHYGLPPGTRGVSIEQCDDGTTLLELTSGEPFWVPTYMLAPLRPTDPFVPMRR